MDVDTILGKGVVIPFRRAGSDIVFDAGVGVVRSALKQILLTQIGELPWRPDFGTNLQRIRHRGITATTLAEIQAEITNAILKFEPRANILNIEVRQLEEERTRVSVRLEWAPVTRTNRENNVLAETQTLEVEI